MSAAPTVDRAVVAPLVVELAAHDTWSRRRLLEMQRGRLDEALRHAVTNSAFYRAAIGPAMERGGSLQDLPVLTKSTLMGQWDRIVTDPRVHLRDVEAHLAGDRPGDLLLGEHRACASGGTTGERAVIVYDGPAWNHVVANVLRWVRVLGATPETRVVGIGAPTPLHITNRAFAELRAVVPTAPGSRS
jgi:phenylacetate-coenzyme A ligase PaaK-like adenylate-forming protein